MLWRNIPIVLIVLPLFISSLTAVLKPAAARTLMLGVNALCVILSALLLYKTVSLGTAFAVKMGEVGAPFGNELYISSAEALTCLAFDLIELLSLTAAFRRADEEIHTNRRGLFFTVCSLLLAALNALTLTNDLFTGYVFIEITTIAAGALIFVRSREGALFASMRYMIMNLLGSGLFLLGLAVLYALTGQLLFPQMQEAVTLLEATGEYGVPLTASLLLITLGLAIKSALYPFHTWLPNAYSLATPAASSLLSSLVSKAYIFLYIKLVLRGIGLKAYMSSGAGDVVFVYAAFAIVLGSVDAIREHNIRRMISYSSVAQIGYIFLAAAIGTVNGICACVFQMLAHSAAKAMLFPAADRLSEVSGGNENFRDLRGSGYRAPLAGAAFTVGAFSITGIPLLGGFSAKLFITEAAVYAGGLKLYAVLAALAASTVLNVVYFLRTVVTVYRKSAVFSDKADKTAHPLSAAALCVFILLNLMLGAGAGGIMNIIRNGIGFWTLGV